MQSMYFEAVRDGRAPRAEDDAAMYPPRGNGGFLVELEEKLEKVKHGKKWNNAAGDHVVQMERAKEGNKTMTKQAERQSHVQEKGANDMGAVKRGLQVFSEPDERHKNENQGKSAKSTRQPVGSMQYGQYTKRAAESSGQTKKGGQRAETKEEPRKPRDYEVIPKKVSELTLQFAKEEAKKQEKVDGKPKGALFVHSPPNYNTELPGNDYYTGDLQKKLVICYWDEMTDISWLARNLSAFSSFQKVSLSLSQTTEKEWKKAVKTSSQVIFYHSRHSKRSVQDLHRFLEQCAYINSEKRVTEETQKKSSSECLDIGIFSRSADRGKLLQTSLSQTNRGGLLKEVRHIDIYRSTKEEIRKEISRCLYAILHVTRKNIGDMDYLSLFEMMKRTALVLIDDLEDMPVGKMPPAKNKIPVAEMNIRPGRLAAMKNRGPKQRPPHRFGIFSRSAEMDYDWLQSLLLAEHFRDQVSDVRSFYISNNGLLQFEEDVSRCSVGILYHTKNRGGINVTDVMSSLYDAELELLSNVLGRDNVLVVIDDLEDSSSSEKGKILEEQPSIGKFAGDLLLVAEVEKKDEFRLLGKLNKIELFNPACKMLTETGYYNL